MKMPPSPIVTTGPNSSSCETPIEHLDAAGHHLAHEHAFDARVLVGPARPSASSSSYDGAHVLRPTRRRRARGRRRSCAAGRATRPSSRPGSRSPSPPSRRPSADVHSSSLLVLMPYAFSSCFEFHSDSASPGFRPSSSLRAFFAAGRGVGGRRRERRAVARRERPVVGVRLHRGDAVVERAERRQPAVEQPLVVRVVGARRARPRSRRSASSWSSTPR